MCVCVRMCVCVCACVCVQIETPGDLLTFAIDQSSKLRSSTTGGATQLNEQVAGRARRVMTRLADMLGASTSSM